MNFRKRKSLRKYFGFIILLLNISCILSFSNTTNISQNESTKVLHSSVDQYDLKKISSKISEKLIRAAYVELGITTLQKIYDSYKFISTTQNDAKTLEKITKKLKAKLSQAFKILNVTRTGLEKYASSSFGPSISTQIYIDPVWGTTDLGNGIAPNASASSTTDLLSKIFSENFLNVTQLRIKHMYFLSTFDLRKQIDYVRPSYIDYDDTDMWQLYLSLTELKPKHILIAIDLGNVNSNHMFNIEKAVAKQLITMLKSFDQVGLIAFGNDVNSPYITGYSCQTTSSQTPLTTDECRIANATETNQFLIHRFIDTLVKSNSTTDHSFVFKQLFNSVRLNFDSDHSEPVVLIYITADSFATLDETKAVLDVISFEQDELDIPVIINTVAVTTDVNEVLHKHHFLRDISERDFTKYNIASNGDYFPGIIQPVNSTFGLGLIVARLFSTVNSNRFKNLSPNLSLPIWHSATKDLMVSLYVPCGKFGELGLLTLDLYFADIAEDVTYFTNLPKYSYAFLLNKTGQVLMHPSFSRPIVTSEQPKFVDISYLEKHENFSFVRKRILGEEKGTQKLDVYNHTLKYTWQHVQNWYIVCIVTQDNAVTPKKIQKMTFADISAHYDLLHHRLDLLPPPSLCRHLNQISTLDAGTVYLSASCFQSPFTYLRGMAGMSVSPLTLQSYMAYIKDNTRLLANPGLKDEVRNDVTVLSHILNYLMRQHLHGALYKYIVRRYVTTLNGVMQMYPGSILDVDLEPTRRSWFVRAIEHPGKIILTSPYLDAGGAGYIVTIAHTVYEGNPTNQHSPNDNIVAVMAMDVTFGYVYKMLLEAVPYCSKQNIKCFIIDDRGYLIYHPNLIDPNGKGPTEQQHIIHKESLVANDILHHKHFVQKILCNNYADGTIQRFYKFNTSLNSVLSNVVHGEHCVKYYISLIPGTNAFVGIVNFTCNDVATFCPCSTVDRLCLICNRVEQNECECPCECPLVLDNETCSQANKSLSDNELCGTLSEHAPVASNMYYSIAAGLKPCLPFLCEVHTTYDTCVGLLGCEWCHLDVDGETKLQNPFCTSLTTCFHGILGSVSPYRDYHLEAMSSDHLFVSAYSSVGPAAGSIIALCFILALVFYCYRQYSLQFMERLYPNSTPCPPQGIQMSNIEGEHFNDDVTSHQDKLLANFTTDATPISPYCITTEYRKPSTAVDSDLGYSTMTPHEESERLSFALIELDSLEDDYNTSDATSINTSASASKPRAEHRERSTHARTTNLPQPVTYLPNRHCILAPVTVHRNMETL